MAQIGVVLVNKKSQQQEDRKSQIQLQIQQFKITNNLINQINFNSTVNRFQYLQELLNKQHNSFTHKINTIVNGQKQVIKQMKNLQKEVKDIKLPTINYNRIINQSHQLIKLKKQSDKNLKLTQGMLTALNKMEAELINLQKPKQQTKTQMENIL